MSFNFYGPYKDKKKPKILITNYCIADIFLGFPSHFLLVSSIFWEGVNFPLGFFQYYAQQRRLAFLLNISYWKPTSSYVVFAGKGYDLLAINTQRGRDHGLGGYNAYRSFFGLERISSMDQRPIEIAPDAWQAFQLVYRDPDDIDLFVGGLSETPMQGT